jgi:uncharacterized protein involved in exopolysaccharide biosynthesis
VAGLTWEEYGRSILDGLSELKADVRSAKEESQRVAIQLALLKEQAANVKAFDARLGALEQLVEAAEARVNTYRKILGAVSLTLVGTILLPILRAWLTTKGGTP